MNENPNKSLEREFERKMKKITIQHQVDTIKHFTDHVERQQKMIVEYVKRGLKLVEDKEFLLICSNLNECYISLDLDEGEEIYLSLVDPKKPYDVGFLVEALVRELAKLWKNKGEKEI